MIEDSYDDDIMSALDSDWGRDYSSFSYKLSIGLDWDSYLLLFTTKYFSDETYYSLRLFYYKLASQFYKSYGSS